MNTIEKGKEAVAKVLDKIGNMPIKAFTAETFKQELDNAFLPLDENYDVSFLMELLNYFPMDKIYISVGSYDQYLYDLQKTVIDNYEKGNYQVSQFYAHLIFMSYVYYCVERAYHLRPERMKDVFYPINSYHGRDDKPDIENYRSIYEFSKIPEKDIFKVFRIMGMEDQQIRELSSYISGRDKFAHATGEGNISEDALIQNIRTIKGNMESLHKVFIPDLKALYVQYLLHHTDSTYEVVWDNVYDFTANNSMSLSDVSYLCNLGISGIRDENEEFKEKYRYVKKVHCAFIEYCIENMGTSTPNSFTDLRNESYLFWRYENDASGYVENELGISAYRCAKDGVDFPVYDCPDCGAHQLAYDVESGKAHCFACETDFNSGELSFCDSCGSIMRCNEINMCDNCIDYKMKDD